ncbi:hypothetical protein AUK04_00690 [Candidatus Roizmanbacteria bacterium CG2_30_33_16]|uniref:Uncharacterized protein n=5 Tax=Candidatus Roizmaniibacteriota TaxID=1752723 RepID=A0A2M7E4I4_9BACT|nr:hypothetical protein [Candidatus Roizmanbacteria bacterium]OIP86390.1 MAG: hypothetical protein AUK04_00690 [Candidatus Roizmanbacteria bacterium CG2_30_33_16]PIP64317.1 MAG: hypothetical protein COW96_03205 [Candidatus Roizmanbacteria bacterium CG22_combo_CG10-13_8_21_14_all_33_16]PIV62650.1 MAG: hypothetical protein COS12_01600 [Candidatus Roizmanbacteria bacterium CG01_land_8_20_14_3_00_33_9]PIX69927.1 MAG: hypothetical protein COZ39_04920 [Candidatus Roizmanbacteria bacterium CG_4_10_14_
MQTIAVVRDRYQITIPDEVRQLITWAQPKSIVSIKVTDGKELVIKPFESKQEDKVNWEKVWKAIHEARIISAQGKKIKLSEFIIEDRQRH